AARAVLDVAPVQSSVSTRALTGLGSSEAGQALSKEDEKQLVREHLVPALRCFLQARDLCPLLPEPQRCLANNADQLARADSRLVYLGRAALVIPYDPGLWFMCGEACLEKQPDQAWKHWKRCLESSNIFLSLILEKSAARLGPHDIRELILPPNPSLLLEAAP